LVVILKKDKVLVLKDIFLFSKIMPELIDYYVPQEDDN